MAGHACRILPFNVMATHTAFHITARLFGVKSAANSTCEPGNSVRHRFEFHLSDITACAMTFRAKRLNRMTRLTVGMIGLRIDAVGESVVQFMYTLQQHLLW